MLRKVWAGQLLENCLWPFTTEHYSRSNDTLNCRPDLSYLFQYNIRSAGRVRNIRMAWILKPGLFKLTNSLRNAFYCPHGTSIKTCWFLISDYNSEAAISHFWKPKKSIKYKILWITFYVLWCYRFIEQYAAEGVAIWGITTTNEPTNGVIPINYFNSLGWTADSLVPIQHPLRGMFCFSLHFLLVKKKLNVRMCQTAVFIFTVSYR